MIMTPFVHSIPHMEEKKEHDLTNFAQQHPQRFFLCWFIALPLFILLALTMFTIVVMFPIAWLFGWL